jgi:hypothetical protein
MMDMGFITSATSLGLLGNIQMHWILALMKCSEVVDL